MVLTFRVLTGTGILFDSPCLFGKYFPIVIRSKPVGFSNRTGKTSKSFRVILLSITSIEFQLTKKL